MHPMICILVILAESLLTGWCRMRMRPVRLVSYAFLYTIHGLCNCTFFRRVEKSCFLFLKKYIPHHFLISFRLFIAESNNR